MDRWYRKKKGFALYVAKPDFNSRDHTYGPLSTEPRIKTEYLWVWPPNIFFLKKAH